MTHESASLPDDAPVARGSMQYLVDIFVPNHSKGLLMDAHVLQRVLGEDRARILPIPFKACLQPASVNDDSLSFAPAAETAIFIERVFDCTRLSSYRKRVFIPNAEWLTDDQQRLAELFIDEVWHKTRFGMDLLVGLFPKSHHRYIGFTSLSTPHRVKNHDGLAHFGGKSKVRYSQELLDMWLEDPSLPDMAFQVYGGHIQMPRWVDFQNLKMFFGFLSDREYRSEFVKYGIQVCTSQMEGFGHYINEARSIGAVIIALDAPPMNELIDASCGVLVPVVERIPHHHGWRFIARPEAIKEAILRAMALPREERERLGANARQRFLQERADFVARLKSATQLGASVPDH